MVKNLKGGRSEPFRGKRGTGTRFKNCVKSMSHRKGVRNPEALCAALGRSKYGSKGMSARRR